MIGGYASWYKSDGRFVTMNFDTPDGANQFVLEKDTAAVTIYRNNKWTEQYRFATKSDLQSNLLYKEFTTESQSWKTLDSYRQNYTDPVGYKFLTICYTRTNGWIGATYAIPGNGFFDIYVPTGSGNGTVTLGALFVKSV